MTNALAAIDHFYFFFIHNQDLLSYYFLLMLFYLSIFFCGMNLMFLTCLPTHPLLQGSDV